MDWLKNTQKSDDEVLADNIRLVGPEIAAVCSDAFVVRGCETDMTILRHFPRERNHGGASLI